MTPLEACAFPVFSLALLKLSDQGVERLINVRTTRAVFGYNELPVT
jgi:hypothetical protein